jgi:hypothetical protein
MALEQDVLKELCNCPYWKRVWIVQETGAATQLQALGYPVGLVGGLFPLREDAKYRIRDRARPEAIQLARGPAWGQFPLGKSNGGM